MLKNKTAIIFMLLTLLGISLMLYVSNNYKVELSQNNNKKPSASVNFVVTNMDLVINNHDGSTKSKIIASKVQHYAQSNQTLLTTPEVIINQENGQIIITADNGKIFHNKSKVKHIQEIYLSDNVVVTRNNLNNSTLPYIKLETDDLKYLPDQDLMTTDKIVKIFTQNSITTAKGLIFKKLDQKLSLIENVHSSYTPDLINNGWEFSKSKILEHKDKNT